jgi:hypothetical protein
MGNDPQDLMTSMVKVMSTPIEVIQADPFMGARYRALEFGQYDQSRCE